MAWNVFDTAYYTRMFLAEVNYKLNGKSCRILTGDCAWEVTDTGKKASKFPCVGCKDDTFEILNEAISLANKCKTSSCGWVEPGLGAFNTGTPINPWTPSFSPNLISSEAQFVWWNPNPAVDPTTAIVSTNNENVLLFRLRIDDC